MKARSQRQTWLRRLVAVGLTALLIWVLLPRPEIQKPNTTWSRTVRDRHGTLLHLSTATDGRYRLRTPLASVSPQWIGATLTKEDRWFRWHPGINPIALLRATWSSITGHPAGGASTLTMQVARLRWGMETRTVSGKLTQIFRAIQLERHYSKDQILEAYFNLAPYGGNVEGAQPRLRRHVRRGGQDDRHLLQAVMPRASSAAPQCRIFRRWGGCACGGISRVPAVQAGSGRSRPGSGDGGGPADRGR